MSATDETIEGLDVIFEDEIREERIQETKSNNDILLPTFIFQINGGSFGLDCVLPENTNIEATALFLHRLNKGHLIEIVMKALLNHSKKTGRPQAEEILSEWASLISKKKPAVRPLQALKIV